MKMNIRSAPRNSNPLSDVKRPFDQAQACLEKSLTIIHSLGQQDLMTVELGRYAEAETGLQESLRLCNDSGNRWCMGTADH